MKIESPIDILTWRLIYPQLLKEGYKVVQYGLMDDIAPDGSPNTACQQSFEKAVTTQQVIEIRRLTLAGTMSVSFFRLFPPEEKPSRQK